MPNLPVTRSFHTLIHSLWLSYQTITHPWDTGTLLSHFWLVLQQPNGVWHLWVPERIYWVIRITLAQAPGSFQIQSTEHREVAVKMPEGSQSSYQREYAFKKSWPVQMVHGSLVSLELKLVRSTEEDSASAAFIPASSAHPQASEQHTGGIEDAAEPSVGRPLTSALILIPGLPVSCMSTVLSSLSLQFSRKKVSINYPNRS